MDGLVILFVIFAIVSSLVSKGKNAANQQQARNRQQAGRATVAPRKRVADQPAQGLQKSTLTAMERPDMRPTLTGSRLHARVDEPYVGSLGGISSEGMSSGEGTDPCHEEQMEAQRQAYEIPDPDIMRADINAIPNLADRQTLVQAVVMSEILTRPAERRRVRL